MFAAVMVVAVSAVTIFLIAEQRETNALAATHRQ
jgi:hypothetical protein